MDQQQMNRQLEEAVVLTGSWRLGQGIARIKPTNGEGELENEPIRPQPLAEVDSPKAVILVVDDFKNDIEGLTLSHGTLVTEHLKRLLKKNQQVTLDKVEIENGATEQDVAKKLRRKLEEYSEKGVRLIVNLSWILIPKSFHTETNRIIKNLDEFHRQALTKFHPTFDNRSRDQQLADARHLSDLIYWANIRRQVRNADSVQPSGPFFVASAGNFGSSRPPLYPARWPYVISVSSCNHEDKKSGFSNDGKVMAPGASFRIEHENTSCDYEGTSFAAPFVAAKLALAPERYDAFSNYKDHDNIVVNYKGYSTASSGSSVQV